MKDVKQCVYKYVYNGSIIYIGKTDSSLARRVCGHKREVKFSEYIDDVKIYYIKLKNKAETSFMETYLINRYKPILNSIDIYDGDSGITMNELEWVEFVYNEQANNKPIRSKRYDYYDDVILGEELESRIKEYGIRTKFTIDEVIDNCEEIVRRYDKIVKKGININSSWFCACGIEAREEICVGRKIGEHRCVEGINKSYFECDIERERIIKLTQDKLRDRYKDVLFISLAAVYEDVYVNKGLNINRDYEIFHDEFEKSRKELTK